MAKRLGKSATRDAARLDGLEAYSYREETLTEALVSGKDARQLEAYFGEPRYQELRELAREVHSRAVRGGPRVLILPGIMGSTLGKPRPFPLLDDVIWFDPVDIAAGRLVDLALNAGRPKHSALGVIPLFYILLKLRLRRAGYDADFHHYDWRLSIDVLGQGLVDRLKDEAAQEIQLVAHSMGGMVARAAIALGAPRITRLVMLGTPNFGSFVPVQAIRAVHPTVQQVAAIDPFHDAEELSVKVFSSFPGLCQMLPTPEKFSDISLYDASAWPAKGPRPRQEILDGAATVQKLLAPADDRFYLVAGVNQETVTGLRKEQDEFVYESSLDGDGTVPLALALLPNAKTYYADESHGGLPNNATVTRAVADILGTGTTTALPEQRLRAGGGVVRSLAEPELRTVPFEGRRGTQLSFGDLRRALEPLLSPEAHDGLPILSLREPESRGSAGGYAHTLERVVVGRRRQHRIDLRLARGSIAEADARAYVLGVYRDVVPSGPALAIDARLDGAISDFTVRRMYTGNVGEVFMLPTGRHPVRADVVMLAGLGHFDRFNPHVLQLTAENAVRICIRTEVEDLATVLFGAGSGQDVLEAMRNLVAGFVRGLRDADADHRFRRITLCETNPQRYERIKQELVRLSTTALFADVELTLDEIVLPEPAPAAAVRAIARGPEPVYLIVRQESGDNPESVYRSSVLTAGAKAAVISDAKVVPERDLARHLAKIDASDFGFQSLDAFGDQLAQLVLGDRVAAVLPTMKTRHLVVVHDAPASRIPWETIRIGGWSPALDAGLSRRYVADNLSVAKWLERRREDHRLDLLLVVNPTGDLDGAEAEGGRIRDLFGAHPSVKIEELAGPKATKEVLLAKFQSGAYDVVHYAGHAFFDPNNPARSGILCHGREVLSGADLAGLGNLPSLVFFNACEAARVRRGAVRRKPGVSVKERIERNVGLAEAFLRGGVANYLGTYWPVGDGPAKYFADTFYSDLLGGQSIGQALLAGRRKVRECKSADWADYIQYGSYDFVLKRT